MTQAPINRAPRAPQPAADTGPNPDKGVHDSSEHTQFTSPPRRLGTSQDFGDREVSHTEDAQEQRAAANPAMDSGAPGHGVAHPSPEQKRSANPD